MTSHSGGRQADTEDNFTARRIVYKRCTFYSYSDHNCRLVCHIRKSCQTAEPVIKCFTTSVTLSTCTAFLFHAKH